ncbi:MAG: 23S rRNA (guanosine(2251)-2'-O)-methyltransferase RlmB [Myxococcota bacterium]
MTRASEPAPPPSGGASTSRLVVGLQPVREALRAHGASVSEVWVVEPASPRLNALVRFAQARGVARLTRVSRAALDRRTRGARHQGVLALAPPLALKTIDALDLTTGGPVVVLDGITDPHNFGAVVRSAVALGAAAVVFGENKAAPLSPATFRASAGAIEHANLVRVASLRDAIDHLSAQGLLTLALDAAADTELPDIDLAGPCAVVVGAEDTGVSRGVRRACARRARLPMAPGLDSLNASVAAALALYEVQRQRRGGVT